MLLFLLVGVAVTILMSMNVTLGFLSSEPSIVNPGDDPLSPCEAALQQQSAGG